MQVLSTIIPIFAVIILGWMARRRGYMQPEFLTPANRLVYNLAIPAMIFRAIAKASLKSQFDVGVLLITLVAPLSVFAAAWILARRLPLAAGGRATFIQNSIHGNLGYVGLAVAYYYLGNEGLVRASIIAGFLIILQNFLAVSILQLHGSPASSGRRVGEILWRIMGNPVIAAAAVGIGFSLFDLPIPLIVERSLSILGGLALPMALLIIGASISVKMIRRNLGSVVLSTALKLLLLPALGLALYRLSGLDSANYLPGLILLASPTATVTYVMAREMQGDTDAAVAAISASTLLSGITFFVWLHAAG